MESIIKIIILGVTVIVLLCFIIIVLTRIIRDIRNYQTLTATDKMMYKTLLLIFSAPIILWWLDAYNVLSKIYPNYINISKEYDWLSFIGTYSGAIIGAILLIFITEKDRCENTRILRESQRPYLDISFMKIDKQFFKNHVSNITIFEHGKIEDKKLEKREYLTLCIKNTGASVAIIDTNRTKVKLRYLHGLEIEECEMFLNFSINRLSLQSGDELYIKFSKNDLYRNGKLLSESKILSSQVYYKDLFNKNYLDECEMSDTLNILHDNEELKPF